jgi:hypothetical protein
MKKGIVAASAVLWTVLLAAGTAEAADDFGRAGELSLGSDLNLATTGAIFLVGGSGGAGTLLTPSTMLYFGGSSQSNNGGSETGFSLAPALDYFVIDNLSLGCEVLFGYASYSPPSVPGITV